MRGVLGVLSLDVRIGGFCDSLLIGISVVYSPMLLSVLSFSFGGILRSLSFF